MVKLRAAKHSSNKLGVDEGQRGVGTRGRDLAPALKQASPEPVLRPTHPRLHTMAHDFR